MSKHFFLKVVMLNIKLKVMEKKLPCEHTFCHCKIPRPLGLCQKVKTFGSLVCDVVLALFVTFQYSVLGQVWFLIVSIPDFCFLSFFGDLVMFIIAVVRIYSVNKCFQIIFQVILTCRLV